MQNDPDIVLLKERVLAHGQDVYLGLPQINPLKIKSLQGLFPNIKHHRK